MKVSLTAVARHFLFVRETLGPNRGAFVEKFQRFCFGVPGDAWCCDFVSYVLDIAYFGKSPLKKSGSCHEVLLDARAKGFIVETPAIDDLFFFVTPSGRAHHIGIVTGIAPLTGIAGNTSEDGTSSEGVGVFEHAIPHANIVYARLP